MSLRRGSRREVGKSGYRCAFVRRDGGKAILERPDGPPPTGVPCEKGKEVVL